MKFLYDSILNYGVKTSGVALEIGVFKGCSLVFLAKACLKREIPMIYGMDVFTGTPSWGQRFDTFDEAANRLSSYGLAKNVTLLRQDSQNCDWDQMVDVLHIDADHEYKAVVQDIEKYIPFVSHGAIVIFDDYDRAHPGVRKAVAELLVSFDDFIIVAVNNDRAEYGSICLRRA